MYVDINRDRNKDRDIEIDTVRYVHIGVRYRSIEVQPHFDTKYTHMYKHENRQIDR